MLVAERDTSTTGVVPACVATPHPLLAAQSHETTSGVTIRKAHFDSVVISITVPFPMRGACQGPASENARDRRAGAHVAVPDLGTAVRKPDGRRRAGLC